jgi:hypothetical protein
MINYLITSTLLSMIGWLAYLFLVRRKAAPWHQKFFIYFILLSSLGLPLITSSEFHDDRWAPPAEQESLAFGTLWQVEESQLQHFCQCENPNIAHRVHYRSNKAYNFFLQHKKTLLLLMGLAMVLVIARMLAQYLFLIYLARTSRKEHRSWKGQGFTILFTPKPQALGAFQLDRPYIIWQEEMKMLEPKEQNAIIQHEISHLRQFNTLEKTLLNLIQCFWLLNPFFYFFRKELDLISERIADQKGWEALGSRKAYASLLVRMKELQSLPLVSAFKGSSLKTRVSYLLQNPQGHWAYPLLALFLVFCLQISFVNDLSAQVDQTVKSLATYEEIYLNHPEEEACYYCTDCHSVCLPEEE